MIDDIRSIERTHLVPLNFLDSNYSVSKTWIVQVLSKSFFLYPCKMANNYNIEKFVLFNNYILINISLNLLKKWPNCQFPLKIKIILCYFYQDHIIIICSVLFFISLYKEKSISSNYHLIWIGYNYFGF